MNEPMTREEFRSITGRIKVQTLNGFVAMLRATNEHNQLIYACASADAARQLSLAILVDSYRRYRGTNSVVTRAMMRSVIRERCSYY